MSLMEAKNTSHIPENKHWKDALLLYPNHHHRHPRRRRHHHYHHHHRHRHRHSRRHRAISRRPDARITWPTSPRPWACWWWLQSHLTSHQHYHYHHHRRRRRPHPTTFLYNHYCFYCNLAPEAVMMMMMMMMMMMAMSVVMVDCFPTKMPWFVWKFQAFGFGALRESMRGGMNTIMAMMVVMISMKKMIKYHFHLLRRHHHYRSNISVITVAY